METGLDKAAGHKLTDAGVCKSAVHVAVSTFAPVADMQVDAGSARTTTVRVDRTLVLLCNHHSSPYRHGSYSGCTANSPYLTLPRRRHLQFPNKIVHLTHNNFIQRMFYLDSY